MQEKIAELIKKKKDSKAVNLYKSAKKSADDIKKINKEKIQKVQTGIRLGFKGIQLTTKMIGKVTSLVEGGKLEFESIKKEIIEFQKTIQQQVAAISQAGQNIISNITSIPTPAAPSVTVLPVNVPQDFIAFNNTLNQLDPKKLSREITNAKNYFKIS